MLRKKRSHLFIFELMGILDGKYSQPSTGQGSARSSKRGGDQPKSIAKPSVKADGGILSRLATALGFSKSDLKYYIAIYDDDLEFLSELPKLAETDPILVEPAQRIRDLVVTWGRNLLHALADLGSKQIHEKRISKVKEDVRAATSKRLKEDLKADAQLFFIWLNDAICKVVPTTGECTVMWVNAS
jgi:hypothetical protein